MERTPNAVRTARLAWCALVLADALWVVASRAWRPSFVSFSDGVYSYLAALVAHRGPHVLYGRVALSQPPSVVLLGAALWRISGHVQTLRVGLVGLAALSSLLGYGLARGLRATPLIAAVAGFLVFAGPLRWAYVGLDGEALLIPLLLGCVLLAARGRWTALGIVAGIGLAIKLTWAPVALAFVVLAWTRGGRRAGMQTVGAGLGSALACWTLLLLVVWQSPLTVAHWMLGAQLHAGTHWGTLVALLLLLVVVWLPLLAILLLGGSGLPPWTRWLAAAVVVSGVLDMTKAGTFWNVAAPAESLLLVLAPVALAHAWRRSPLTRSIAGAAVVVLAIHILAIVSPAVRRVPVPLTGAFVTPVPADRLTSLVAVTRTAQPRAAPVLVDPLVALLAHRREVNDEADWFILHAAASHCDADWCQSWPRVLDLARASAAVVSAEPSVDGFDRTVGRIARSIGPQRAHVEQGALHERIHTRR